MRPPKNPTRVFWGDTHVHISCPDHVRRGLGAEEELQPSVSPASRSRTRQVLWTLQPTATAAITC